MSATFGSFNQRESQPPERPVKPKPNWRLLREKWGPWTVALIVAFGVWFFPSIWIVAAPWRDSMLADVISASTIFVAYLLTAATILPTLEDRPLVRKLRAWGYYDRIVAYISRAAYAAGFLLLLSLLAVVMPTIAAALTANFGKWLPHVLRGYHLTNRIFSALWWANLCLTAGCTYVATRTLMSMLRLPRE